MAREEKTIAKMLSLFCEKKHHSKRDELCPDCRELLDYAKLRLKNCPFQEGKTNCGNCKIHCYKVNMREKIREVMRFSGPKMLLRHPFLALWHLLYGFRKNALPRKKRKKL